jgi:hypothetical protein
MNHFFKTHHLPRRLLHVLIPGLILFTGLVTTLALFSCVLLLAFDLFQPFLHFLTHAPVSAVPLLLIGLASLSFQMVIRPKLLDFLKSLLVSSAFILRGVDQLLPAGWVATMLGDVVIVLYIVDLGWVMIDQLIHQGWPKQVPLEDIAHPVQVLPPTLVVWEGVEEGKEDTSTNSNQICSGCNRLKEPSCCRCGYRALSQQKWLQHDSYLCH